MGKNEYIKQVLALIHAPRNIKRKIKEDLEQRISDAMDDDPYYNILEDMGYPKDLADEMNENMYEHGKLRVGNRYAKAPYEFKSKATLFGVPLVHINMGGNYGTKTAKGIIALGDVAVGVIAFGGVSLGVISLGGISIGIAALGGLAFGGIALGGVAIGGLALGGAAVGFFHALGGAVV